MFYVEGDYDTDVSPHDFLVIVTPKGWTVKPSFSGSKTIVVQGPQDHRKQSVSMVAEVIGQGRSYQSGGDQVIGNDNVVTRSTGRPADNGVKIFLPPGCRPTISGS